MNTILTQCVKQPLALTSHECPSNQPEELRHEPTESEAREDDDPEWQLERAEEEVDVGRTTVAHGERQQRDAQQNAQRDQYVTLDSVHVILAGTIP